MARVIDCRPRETELVRGDARRQPSQSKQGWFVALLTAIVLVPFAGAAAPPAGWTAAATAALVVLALAAVFGQRVRWGWLCVIAGIAGLVTPRGTSPLIGPVLLVTCVLCGEFWYSSRRRRLRQSIPGVRELGAQQLAGLSGELQVGQVLGRDLPEQFTVLNGLKLPRGAGDIDHLVVGPTGLFLLETKTMAGQIVCGPDGTWRRTKIGRAGTPYAAFIGDPAAQVQRNIRAVRECLERRCPQLVHRHSAWIEGMVVFPHPRAELQAELSRVPAVRVEEATERIVGNVPRRWLQPADVAVIVDALIEEARQPAVRGLPSAQSAQAMVEVALALPVVLTLLFGTVALSRVIRAQTAIVAVAHQAARAGALGRTPAEAADQVLTRAAVVAPGFGISPQHLSVASDATRFDAEPARVTAIVRYSVDLTDLPLIGWVPSIDVHAEHVEFVDPFRSGVIARGGSGP